MDYVAKVALLLAKAGFDPSRLAGQAQDDAIKLLLDTAEDATSTPEAQAYTAMAAKIMAERGINAAMMAAANAGADDGARKATDEQIGPMGRPFQHQRKDLAVTIGAALGLHPVINRLPSSQPGKYREDIKVHLFGAAGDIKRAKLLFDSTMLQGLHVMGCELDRDAGSSQKQSWLQGWAAGVGHVLDLAEKNARQSYDQEHALEPGHRGTELVLADWNLIVLTYRADLYPALGRPKRRSTSGNQFTSGFRAGTQANIGARTARPTVAAIG